MDDLQDVGGWYIENITTLIKDPVSEENTRLWNTGLDSDKDARKRKRKLSCLSNILVVSRPKHPENEGPKFSYSSLVKKIFDKITEAMIGPPFKDEKPMNPFDFEGANFKLKIRKG